MNILGISAYYHDSAAALIRDGEIIAAAQEERFTRKKHDPGFPTEAVRYCLAEGGLTEAGVDAVAFYDKPITKFGRIMETYFSVAPRGLRPFMMAIPLWMREKLWIPLQIEKSLEACGVTIPHENVYFTEHHESHAASAFFPSPFENAAVLTIDGVGEWGTSSIGHGVGNRLNLIEEMHFPHSLGLLYSAFTYFTGFRVNSGEYKLMGLAPYGEPKYVDLIREHLLDLKDDGSFRLNMDYFGYLDGLTMTNDKFAELFGGPARSAESDITRREMDLARSIQVVTEDIVMKMAHHAKSLTGENNLCLAGGVALNCVANGILKREGPFENIWIQPAAGDAGGALGAALTVWHTVEKKPRNVTAGKDAMKGSYLGPDFSDDEIEAFLKAKGYGYQKLAEPEWSEFIARHIDEGNVIGLCQGRMEFGPRALGGRSIIGDARSPKMQSVMNLKIKYRESFRPFAPSCLAERASDYFELEGDSPYMLLVAPVQPSRCNDVPTQTDLPIRDWVNQIRSDIPAITHVDNSARVQTVTAETNERFYNIIKAFEARTGEGIVINTSFNVRGEPIVCTPEDAYRCFMRTEMDVLVLNSFVLTKDNQPEWDEGKDWREDFVLD
ncbi:MAG: carbamoyltransferase [Candidatus Promineifilaceae bacterium]|jgi:carbamoyltransferase